MFGSSTHGKDNVNNLNYRKRVAICDISAGLGMEMIPYLWCLLKTYYEQRGKNSAEWQWEDPWQFRDERSDSSLIDYYQNNPPDVFLFSVYVWNQPRMNLIAQEIRKNHPKCLIVYGGPQCDIKYNPDFFREHPWVDIVTPGDGYGEIITTAILDNYTDYETYDFSKIPYIYYADNNRNAIWSDKLIDKRSFEWANNVFQAQEEHLLPKLEGKVFWSLYETSRGCPYRCSYCDWGGGTYTKTVKKPFATVLSELEWLSKNKCYLIGITDANFGIFDIDITIAEYINSYHEKYGYPKRMNIENAKNHPERVAKITKIFAAAGMLELYRISIQSINDEIKKNIDRIDIPFKKQLRIFKELQSTIRNLPIKVETIMGLPGATIKSHMIEIDTVLEAGLSVPRPSTWMLLPESPAYSPEYRKQFKIETVKKYNMSYPWALKKNLKVDEGVYSMETFYNLSVESVVGTYSYSKQDWIYMQMTSGVARPLSVAGGKYLFSYMKKKHRMKPSVLIKLVVDRIYETYKDRSIDCFSHFYKTLDYFNEWIEKSNSPDSGIDHAPNFPIIFSAPNYITWRTLINFVEIYSVIKESLLKKYNDDKINDLIDFICGIILDISYDPTVGRTFVTEYDWLNYFQSGKRLSKHKKSYKISDQEILLDVHKTHKIDWQEYKHDIDNFEKQYFYLMCTNIDLDRTSKKIETL